MRADFHLCTARLVLRPGTPADRADLIALEADAEVMLYLNGGQPVPDEGLPDADFLTPRGHEKEVLVVHDLASGRFVGWFALLDDGVVDGVKTGELGYRLRRAAWRKGYATEAALGLVQVALGAMGFACLRAETMAVNQGSRRVLEKAGFRHVGTRPYHGTAPLPGAELGEVIYEIRVG